MLWKSKRERALEERIEHLERRVQVLEGSTSGDLISAEGVPLSRVISEYLYGEEEGDGHE